MTVLDLFSGIGGMSLGLESIGFRTVAFCEVEPFCREVLAHHWPGVPIHEDVRTLRGSDVGAVDLVAGGFPCQPVSVAGRRKGEADARWLWPEMLRLVREVRPRWVLAENVPGLRTLGADRVLEDLEAAGYTCWPLVVGADDVGAPHRRKRVWIMAHCSSSRREVGSWTEGRKAEGWSLATIPDRNGSPLADSDAPGRSTERSGGLLDGERQAPRDDADGCGVRPVGDISGLGDATDTRPQEPEGVDSIDRERKEERGGNSSTPGLEQQAELSEGILPPRDGRDSSGTQGVPLRWPARPGEPQHEWEAPRLVAHASRHHGSRRAGATGPAVGDEGRGAMDRPAGTAFTRRLEQPEQPLGGSAHGLPKRLVRRANREALRALGNAVVPQVVEAIGRAILAAEAMTSEEAAA